VEGNRDQPEELCASEAKTDEADVSSSLERIEFRAARDKSLEQSRIDLVIEHQEIAPLSGQEYATARLARRTGCGLHFRNCRDH
jgi:hypothetical protein